MSRQIRESVLTAGQVEERQTKDEGEETHAESRVQRDVEGKHFHSRSVLSIETSIRPFPFAPA